VILVDGWMDEVKLGRLDGQGSIRIVLNEIYTPEASKNGEKGQKTMLEKSGSKSYNQKTCRRSGIEVES